MSKIKSYKQFLEALSGPGNLPMFTYTGVNYGDASKGVSGHFGDKPTATPQNQTPSGDNFVLSDESDEYYDQDDVNDLLRQYDIWCKQNDETPIPLDKIDGKVVDYLKNLLDNE